MKLKKGDKILVTAGKDRGREGAVEKVFVSSQLVLVPGLNQYKRHTKKKGENQPGEILTLSRPLPVGNVALVCPKCKLPTRVGYRLLDDKKVRVCRKCDQEIDGVAKLKKTKK
ncbi:MAG: 50S ribosomal protein L24 [Patescibacteria group bacterium]